MVGSLASRWGLNQGIVINYCRDETNKQTKKQSANTKSAFKVE